MASLPPFNPAQASLNKASPVKAHANTGELQSLLSVLKKSTNPFSGTSNVTTATALVKTTRPSSATQLSQAAAVKDTPEHSRKVEADRFKAIHNEIKNNLPDLRVSAHDYMREQVRIITGKVIDPDKIWFHTFASEVTSHTSFSGWEHRQTPVRSQTLTDLAIGNFSVEDERAGPGQVNTYSGFYTVGPDYPGTYGVNNEVALLPSDLMKKNWGTDFYTLYKSKAEIFWKEHQSSYRTLLKGQFIADAKTTLSSGTKNWSREDHNMAITIATQGGLPGLEQRVAYDGNGPPSTISVSDLEIEIPVNGAVRQLDIYGYMSDILHFSTPNAKNGNTRQLLYIPGGDPAFIAFKHIGALRDWIVQQAKNPQDRNALAGHFSLYDRQDGRTSGVDTALKGLAENPRSWPRENYINMKNAPVKGDVFTHMVQQIKERSTRDADTLIKSDGELDVDLWVADLTAGEQILLPLAPLGAPLGMVTAAGGFVLAALGTDKAIYGDTPSSRKAGVSTALQGTLDILFSLGAASETNATEDPYAIQAQETNTRPSDHGAADALQITPNAVAEGVSSAPAAPTADMVAVSIDGNSFWVNNSPNVLGHFELYRRSPDGTLTSASQYAQRSAEGEWQRIGLQGGGGAFSQTAVDSPSPQASSAEPVAKPEPGDSTTANVQPPSLKNRVDINLADGTKISGKPRKDNEDIVDILDSRGQRTKTYIKSPNGDVWSVQEDAKPASGIKPPGTPQKRVNWKTLKDKVDRVLTSEAEKEQTADYVIKKGVDSPSTAEGLLDASADRLGQAARELKTIRQDLTNPAEIKECESRINVLQNRASTYRKKGQDHRVAAILRDDPSAQNLDYLLSKNLTVSKLRLPKRKLVKNARTRTSDYIDTYDFKVNGQPWAVGHFHYPKADSLASSFTAAHLKKPSQQYMGSLAEDAATRNGQAFKVHRSELLPNLVSKVFNNG